MKLSVDVIMVTYNHERYISNAIDGVLKQRTNFDVRLIIANDCSPDRTDDIVSLYAKEYSKEREICYFRNQTNIGGQSNFIKAHGISNAKYIAMCEGDDYWTDPYKLQKQVDLLEANPDFNICFHKVKIEKQGSLMDDYITAPPAATTTQQDLLKGNYIHTVSVVFRNVIKNFPDWFSKALPGDYPLWLMLTNKGEKISCLDEFLAVYRVHEGGLWSLQDKTKYNQKMYTTMMSCALYLKIKCPKFIKYYMPLLADSLYLTGFKDLDQNKYLSIALWAIRHAKFSIKQKFYFLTIGLRRFVKQRP